MKEDDQTFDKTFHRYLLWFVLSILIICAFPLLFTLKSCVGDFTNTGQIGDTIGGIMGPFVAICVGVLTFFAFWVQFKANEQQKVYLKKQDNQHKIERFETRLFEMIKWHRDNVGEMKIIKKVAEKNINTTQLEVISSHVFYFIFIDFCDLFNELELFFSKDIEDIYENGYREAILKNGLISARQIDLFIYSKIDIIYSILFFGLSKRSRQTLINQFSGRYKSEFYEPILFAASVKPSLSSKYWKQWILFSKETKEFRFDIINNWYNANKHGAGDEALSYHTLGILYRDLFEYTFTKYYGGHQFRLAHYYQNLFQIISFIDKSKILVENSKKEYAKLLKAQLSTYEQVILFLNSISILGREWELENRQDPKSYIKSKLISNYKLLSNISNDELLPNLFITKFYPDIFNK